MTENELNGAIAWLNDQKYGDKTSNENINSIILALTELPKVQKEVDIFNRTAIRYMDLNTALEKEIAKLREALEKLILLTERLVKRIDCNGGLGEYKGGPSFVMHDIREGLGIAKSALDRKE